MPNDVKIIFKNKKNVFFYNWNKTIISMMINLIVIPLENLDDLNKFQILLGTV